MGGACDLVDLEHIRMPGEIGGGFTIPRIRRYPLSLKQPVCREIFRLSGTDLTAEGKTDKLREELADVISCAVLMADACGPDIDEIVKAKVARDAGKYPVEKARGSNKKYTELE